MFSGFNKRFLQSEAVAAMRKYHDYVLPLRYAFSICIQLQILRSIMLWSKKITYGTLIAADEIHTIVKLKSKLLLPLIVYSTICSMKIILVKSS